MVSGELNSGLLEDTIVRSLDRLRETGETTLVNDQIEKIKDWFTNVYGEQPDFLN